MKKEILYYLSAVCVMLFSACENDLPYHIGKQEKLLIVNAMFEAGAKENGVYLNLSGTNKIDYNIRDGAVTLYVNDEKKETVEAVQQHGWDSSNESDLQKICILKTLLHPGDRIRLEASADSGKYQASAEVVVPQPIGQIEVDTFLTRIKVGAYMTDCMRYKITLNDHPGEKNYYQLVIRDNEYWGDPDGEKEWMPYEIREIINQEEVVLTDGHISTGDDDEYNIFDRTIENKHNIFTDARFQDASYTLKVYTNYRYGGWVGQAKVADALISILSITKMEYHYIRVLSLLESEKYEPTFMEPVVIPTNVQGGLGFVGASSASQVRLRLADWRKR